MTQKLLILTLLAATMFGLSACAQEEEAPPPPPYSHATLNPEQTITEWFTALQAGDAVKATELILPSINSITSNYVTDFGKNLYIMPQQTLNMNTHHLLTNQMITGTVAPDKHAIINPTTPTPTTQYYEIQVEYTIEGRTLETIFTAYRVTQHYWVLQGGYGLTQLEFNQYAPEYLVNDNIVNAEQLNRTLNPNIYAAFVFEPIRYNVKLPDRNLNFTLNETSIQQVTLESLTLKPERLESIQSTIKNNISSCLDQPREDKEINCPNWYYQSTPYINLIDSRWVASTPTFNPLNLNGQNTAYVTMSLTLNLTHEQYVDQRRKTDTETITRQETVQRSATITNHYLNSRGELQVDILWGRTPPTKLNPTTVDGETIIYAKNSWM